MEDLGRYCRRLHESLTAWQQALGRYGTAIEVFAATGQPVDQALHQRAVAEATDRYHQVFEDSYVTTPELGRIFGPELAVLAKVAELVDQPLAGFRLGSLDIRDTQAGNDPEAVAVFRRQSPRTHVLTGAVAKHIDRVGSTKTTVR